MTGPLRFLYNETRTKYLKLLARFRKRRVSPTRFRHQRKQLDKLLKLQRRVAGLELKAGILTTGSALLMLSAGGSADAQALGPFKENVVKNPLPPPHINYLQPKVAIVDIDADGDLDGFVGTGAVVYPLFNPSGSQVNHHFFVNDQFTTDPYFDNFYYDDNEASPAFADVDHDGDLDLLIGYSSGNLVFWRNIGTATDPLFMRESGASNPFTGIYADGGYAIPTFVDWDGDTWPDLFLTGGYSFNETISYYKNSNGVFQHKTGPENPLEQFNHLDTYDRLSVDFANLDSDSDLDLALGQNGYYTRLFINNGTSFDAVGFNPQLNEYSGIPEFIDLNNDGFQDLILGTHDYYGNEITAYINDGTNVFTKVQGLGRNPFDGVEVDREATVAFEDVTGDGELDAVLGNKYDNKLFVYPHTPDGFIEDPTHPLTLFAQDYATTPIFADIDGDTFDDLFVPNEFGLDYFPNDGTGTFVDGSASNPLNGTNLSHTMGFLNFDGDSDLDALGFAGDYSGYQLEYFVNTGTPTAPSFSATPSTAPAPFDTRMFVDEPHIYITDINHDGHPDIFADETNYHYDGAVAPYYIYEYRNYLFMSNGDGTFTETPSPLPSSQIEPYSHPTFVDTDNDGDLDIIIGLGGNGIYYSGNYLYTNANGQFRYFENQNPAPVLGLSGGSLTYTLGSGPVVLDASLTLSDADGDLIQQATVTINGYLPGEEILDFTAVGPITGSFTNGTLLLTGPATLAEFEATLRTVSYEYTGSGFSGGRERPSHDLTTTTNRAVIFDVRDQDFTVGGNAQFTVAVITPNQVPALSGSGATPTFMSGGGPVVIDGGLTATDNDDTDLQGATVQISPSTYIASEDELLFSDQNGITGVWDPGTGTLTLSGTAALTNYQTAIRSVTYNNTGAAPTHSDRTIEFQTTDGEDVSNLVTVTVTLPNQPPLITTSGTNAQYAEGGPDVAIDPGLTLADPDDTDLVGGTVTITPATLVSSEDQLVFTNQNGITGSYSAATGVLTLTGTATLANYQAALRSVAYSNSSGSPTAQDRIVEFIVDDGDDMSTPATNTVQLTPNQAPVITAGGAAPQYTAGGSPVAVDDALTVSDGNDTSLTGATVLITPATFVSGEDELNFSDQNGITGSYNSSSGVLTLTGTSSVSNYQAALRSVTYSNSAVTVNTQNRSITFVVDDGKDTSTPVTKVLTVTISNQPPVITPQPVQTSIKGQANIQLTEIISDPDGNLSSFTIIEQPISGAVATIVGNKLIIDYSGVDFAGQDRLRIRACDSDGACTESDIFIDVIGDIEVFDAISPDGNGKNDYFYIRWIEILYPQNKVSLYSRWGDLVFEIENYNNTSRRFEGLNNNGKELAAGVYFYKIEMQGRDKPVTGYLTIKR